MALTVVFALKLAPVSALPLVFDWWDKAQHALAFMVLTGWTLLMWPSYVRRVVLGMLVYVSGIEVAQYDVGWRFADWADLAADAMGVLVAWGGVIGIRQGGR